MAVNTEIADYFSAKMTARHWGKIGMKKRAGVALPLFSIYSKRSRGIGQITDLRLLAEWCELCGLSIIQLLPLNDVGFSFRPYDAQSMFALDPMYLDLEELAEIDSAGFRSAIQLLSKRFPLGGVKNKIDYGVKKAKLALLWDIYHSGNWRNSLRFDRFIGDNEFWLKDYCLFKVLKEQQQEKHWQEWPEEYRNRRADALQAFQQEQEKFIGFQAWLQWQLFEQFLKVKADINRNGIWLMGDIPFLVSGDSADVWAKQNYFKLDLAAGAPPDYYLASGQRWGMPPYNWPEIANHQYDYLTHKLRYAQNFYDLYRIDHFVGIFRLWTVPVSAPIENGGLYGKFDPEDESRWEEHGKKLLRVMLESTAMLPCAEDLGTIPPCSYRVLDESGVVGMDVQRWSRDWDRTYEFKPPEKYRLNSIATISTHDMTTLRAWWENEAGTVDDWLFQRKCQERGFDYAALKPSLFDPAKSRHGRNHWRREIHSQEVLLSHLQRRPEEVRDFIDLYAGSYREQEQFWNYLKLPGEWQADFSPALARRSLETINQSASIFSIQFLQDWLAFTTLFDGLDAWDLRVNRPGSTSDNNWSLVMPFSLEDMLALPENSAIKKINADGGRV